MLDTSKGHQGKEQEEDRNVEDGEKLERKLSGVNSRVMSREQKELIGEFKIVAGDVISIVG